MNVAYGELLQAQIDELTRVVDRHLETTKRIHGDRGLNTKGKGERLATTGNAARDQVFQIAEQRRRKIDQDLKQAEQNIPDGLPGRQPVSQAERIRDSLRQSEIRQALLDVPGKLVRTAQVQQAAETNDLELLLAVQDAPRIIFEKIVGDTTFEEARNRWLELNRPDQFKRVSTVGSALSLFGHNVQTAENIIAKASGIPLRRDVPTQAELEAQLARAS